MFRLTGIFLRLTLPMPNSSNSNNRVQTRPHSTKFGVTRPRRRWTRPRQVKTLFNIPTPRHSERNLVKCEWHPLKQRPPRINRSFKLLQPSGPLREASRLWWQDSPRSSRQIAAVLNGSLREQTPACTSLASLLKAYVCFGV